MASTTAIANIQRFLADGRRMPLVSNLALFSHSLLRRTEGDSGTQFAGGILPACAVGWFVSLVGFGSHTAMLGSRKCGIFRVPFVLGARTKYHMVS